MRKLVVRHDYTSPLNTLVSLSYLTDDSKHIVMFDTERGAAETVETVHPTRDKARDHWRQAAQLLDSLGFKRI